MRNIRNLKRAFTLSETLIALLVIAFISVLTLSMAVNSGATEEKRITATSQKVYHDIDTIYTSLLSSATKSFNITRLKARNGHDINSSPSELLKDYLMEDLEGVESDCSYFSDSSIDEKLKTGITCFTARTNMYFGVKLDPSTCDNIDGENTLQIKEYYTKDNSDLKIVDGSCGFIIYSVNSKKFKGIYSKDVFTIALGKRGLK